MGSRLSFRGRGSVTGREKIERHPVSESSSKGKIDCVKIVTKGMAAAVLFLYAVGSLAHDADTVLPLLRWRTSQDQDQDQRQEQRESESLQQRAHAVVDD